MLHLICLVYSRSRENVKNYQSTVELCAWLFAVTANVSTRCMVRKNCKTAVAIVLTVWFLHMQTN